MENTNMQNEPTNTNADGSSNDIGLALDIQTSLIPMPEIFDYISNFDFKLILGALECYECRLTDFPASVIKNVWSSGKYSEKALTQIANMFIMSHQGRGEKDWTENPDLNGNMIEAWCKFLNFCFAWCTGFTTLHIDNGNGHTEDREAFYCRHTKRWYPKTEYIANPYRNFYIPNEWIKGKTEGEPQPGCFKVSYEDMFGE